MTVSDLAAGAYVVVAIESLLIASCFWRAKDGWARKILIADRVILALYMVSLMAAYICRVCGMDETTLEVQRAATRWLTLVYALVLAPQVYLMLKDRKRRERREMP